MKKLYFTKIDDNGGNFLSSHKKYTERCGSFTHKGKCVKIIADVATKTKDNNTVWGWEIVETETTEIFIFDGDKVFFGFGGVDCLPYIEII